MQLRPSTATELSGGAPGSKKKAPPKSMLTRQPVRPPTIQPFLSTGWLFWVLHFHRAAINRHCRSTVGLCRRQVVDKPRHHTGEPI